MGSAEIRATRDGKSPVTTGICSSSQFFDPTPDVKAGKAVVANRDSVGRLGGPGSLETN